MKPLLSLVLLLVAHLAMAQVTVVPSTSDIEARPGEVKRIKLVATDDATKERIQIAELLDLGDPETFFLTGLSAWKLENSKWVSDGNVIFTKTDVTKAPLVLGYATGPIEVRFAGWKWVGAPQEVAQNFSYEDVPLFSRAWWRRYWPVTLALLILIGVLGVRVVRPWLRRRALRRQQQKLRRDLELELSRASSLPELSTLWRKRDDLREAFAHRAPELDAFFRQLNQVQFKPQVSPEDLRVVLAAKDQLLTKLGEVPRGV